MPITPIQSNNFPSNYPSPGNPITATGNYGVATQADSTLICILAAYQDTGSDAITPSISAPSTPGFTWTLAGEMVVGPLETVEGQLIQAAVAIYYIASADSMATDVVTTCGTNLDTSGGEIIENLFVFDLIEIGGLSGLVDVYATGTGFSTIPSAGSLVASNPDFILVVGSFVPNPAAGAGFTLLDFTGFDNIGAGYAQYILNAIPETYNTTFGTGGGDVAFPWACLAVGFSAAVGPSPPTVTSVTPNSGCSVGDTPVTITGTNFTSPATVDFGSSPATDVVVVSSTEITCLTPAGSPGVVAVSVTTAAGTGSLPSAFTYLANPTVTGVSPNNGYTTGGTPVTISGTNFSSPATVSFGANAATSVVVVSSTQITCNTPAGSAGNVTVTVTNGSGCSGDLADAFLYVTPPIPILQVAPLSLGFAGNVGDTTLPSQNFNISNGNGGTLNWTTASDQGWLSASLSSGAGNTTVAAQVNMSGLAVGTYVGHITVASTGAEDSPQVITVTLDVSQPILVVAPLTLEYTAAQFAANPPSQNIAISNDDGGVLNWNIVSDSAWLTTGVASGTNAATVAVSVSSAGFGVGTYTGHLTVTAPGALDSPQIVTVTLVITPAGGGGANCVPVGGNGVFINDLDLYIGPATALYTNMVPTLDLAVNESEANGRHGIIVDFNDSDGLYSRDLGVILTWPIASGTILDLWQPSVIASEDDLYNRFSYHFLIDALGLKGWGHVRELNIAHNATADMNLLLSFDQWPDINITIPNSAGETTKVKVIVPPNKAKMIEGFLSSTVPFMLWGASCELKLGEWGRSGPYKVIKPFAG